MGDLVGRKRAFLASAGLFVLFGLVVTLAPYLATVFVARGLQGAAAAFMIPASISILTHAFAGGPARNRALSTFNAAGAVGFSAGLVIGGVVILQFGWRWAFALSFPTAILIVALGAAIIPTSGNRSIEARRQLDVAGVGLIAAARTSLVLALTLAAEHGVSRLEIGLIALSAVLGALFVRTERRASSPLVPLPLFSNPHLRRANLASLTLLGSFFGFNLLVNLLLVDRFGFSAIGAGMVLLPMAVLCVVIAQFLVPVLLDRFRPFLVSSTGLAAIGSSVLLMAIAASDLPVVAIGAVAALAGGVGMGLAYAPLAIETVSGVDESDQGVAAGLQQTTLQIGGVIGIALAVGGVSPTGASWGGFMIAAAIAVLGAVITLRR